MPYGKKGVVKVSVFFLFLFVLGAGHVFAHQEKDTWTGFLIDEHCFLEKANDPGSDARGCKLMEGCAKSGYGIAIKDGHDKYKFYYFDGKFFTNLKNLDGTGGQKTAYNFIVASTKETYLPVTVKGKLLKDRRKSTSNVNLAYEVIEVKSLAEATPHEAKDLPTAGAGPIKHESQSPHGQPSGHKTEKTQQHGQPEQQSEGQATKQHSK
ncbi:MAG: hypothetical protein LBP21_09855 [Synergistaceae bacterium]|jgi:hypothetical protein|nr:hypothetical protein [Synergistaceae bacterium]